jgi:predicted nucleotidyltransferase
MRSASSRLQLPIPNGQIEAFCRKWRITELAVFGSILRDDFTDDSDVDLLVAFAPGARPSLLQRVQMVEELERLFGRRVDLIERRAVLESPNYIRRKEILESAEVLYGS